jgi:hypothetical protein
MLKVRLREELPCEFYEETISTLHEPLAILVKHKPVKPMG